MIFSEKLRTIRNEKKLTQEKLAELLDVSRQAVSKWESGRGYPEVEKLVELSDIFEISLDELLKDQSDGTVSVSNENLASVTEEIHDKKNTASFLGVEFNPDIMMKMFWGGVKLGAFATAAAFFNK